MKIKGMFLLVALSLTLTTLRAQEFTFGAIPDTQNLTEDDSTAQRIKDITGWFVDHRNGLNLQMVAALGDMTQWGEPNQWQRVREAYDLLKNAGIPYAPCQGNHDPQLDRFNRFFSECEFVNMPTYGGNLDGMENAYYLFSQAGMNFIVVVIQTHDQYIGTYDVKSIEWANTILTQYANHRAIFITHDFYENRKLVDDVIKKHDNLFLALCGHSCRDNGEMYWTEKSPSGKEIHCIMSDYQCHQNKKAAILRYYTFKPAEDKIYAFTYDAYNKVYMTGPGAQFSFHYEMEPSTNTKK